MFLSCAMVWLAVENAGNMAVQTVDYIMWIIIVLGVDKQFSYLHF